MSRQLALYLKAFCSEGRLSQRNSSVNDLNDEVGSGRTRTVKHTGLPSAQDINP